MRAIDKSMAAIEALITHEEHLTVPVIELGTRQENRTSRIFEKIELMIRLRQLVKLTLQ